MNSIALPLQTICSENVRVSIKRLASDNGGLASLCRALGFPYKRTWERVNRNVGDLLDGVVGLAQTGFDEPLRIAADAAGYDVIPKMKFLRTTHAPTKAVRSHALDLHHATAAVTMIVEDALADKMIDDKERERVKSALHQLRKSMAALEGRLENQ